MPFRTAHTVLSRSVSRSQARAEPISADLLNDVSKDALGASIGLTDTFVEAALDPWAFVEARTIPGGPAPVAVEAAIAAARERLATDEASIDERRYRVVHAAADRGRRIQVLAGT